MPSPPSLDILTWRLCHWDPFPAAPADDSISSLILCLLPFLYPLPFLYIFPMIPSLQQSIQSDLFLLERGLYQIRTDNPYPEIPFSSPEMLHSLHLPEMWTFNGNDMTVFERQQAKMEWLQQQNHVVDLSSNPVSQFQGFISSSFHADGVEFGATKMGFVAPEAAVDHSGSWSSGSTAAVMETVTMKAEGEDVVLMEKMESKANKRKAEVCFSVFTYFLLLYCL